MKIKQFIKESGFKALALAKLSQCEYSLVLYLLNCTASGLDEIITIESELANFIGYKENLISKSLSSLAKKNIVKIKQGLFQNPQIINHSISIKFQQDISAWKITTEKLPSVIDAIVYPFLRHDEKDLELIKNTKEKIYLNESYLNVIRCFQEDKNFTQQEDEENARAAKILVDTYPLNSILLILKHFRDKIDSLSYLASSWQHFQELYEQETHEINFQEAKKKHDDEDEKLRAISKKWLKERSQHRLSTEEIDILNIIINHKHPRRQLFWAFKLRYQYPNLKSYFEQNTARMLPVTGSGTIVKKKPES